MPKSLFALVRESIFQPRVAARYIANVSPSSEVVFLGALLLAVASVLSQYLMFGFVSRALIDDWTMTFNMPFIDVAFQFIRIFVIAQVTVFLAKRISFDVQLFDVVKVFVWYNLILQLLFGLTILVMLMFGLIGLLIILFTAFWAPYAAALFWSELFDTKKLFLGFAIAVVAFLIASAISAVVAGFLGLPVMEIIPNV
ncbi:MAG: hypothetical protein AAED33_03985 [Paracoccaceae bacterium]|jgi:hypothetical protein